MKHIKAEYIWLDGQESPMAHLRSKVRVLPETCTTLQDFPEWSFDGGSTYQSGLHDSDLALRPARVYANPFTEGYLVLCGVYKPDGEPHETNTRRALEEQVYRTMDHPGNDPWVGFEQEYTLFLDDQTPLAWEFGEPSEQGNYYCSVGSEYAFGRDVVEEHLDKCLEAGVDLYGTNAEVMPSQWEFQTGPQNALKAADDLWVARYILERVCERRGIYVSFHPKPCEGTWNGAGCHTNFSTGEMRKDYHYIVKAMNRLDSRHKLHMEVYGEYNEQRMTGDCETSSFEKFSSGVADRGCSIRIPAHVKVAGKGYLEDRRPGANIDPYKVCSRMIKSVCFDED